MNEHNYVQYCENLVKGICKKPESVSVVKTLDERGVLLTISVDRSDMSNVIGIAGDTAKAIRRLVRVAGTLENAKVSMKILEPDRHEQHDEQSDY